jgi:ribosome-associated protein
MARVAARAADEKLGEDILVVDVRRESTLVDCFLLVTGLTHLHIGAIEDAVREALRAGGAKLVRTDGQRGHLWRALDYGNFIVHIMDKKTREFYAIEKLWERGKPLTWKMPAPKKRPVKPKPKPLAKKTASKLARKANKSGKSRRTVRKPGAKSSKR